MPRRRDGAYYLFHDYDLRAVCDNQREQMKKAIENADGNAIRSGDLDALTEAYVAQFALDVPELAEGATSVEVWREAQVDVSHDPTRFILDRDEPFYVPGIRAAYFVPYTGDGQLFKCQPSTFTTVIPAITDLLEDELVFAVERADQNVAATKQAFEGELNRVKEFYLAWVRQDAATFNASLPADARRWLTTRRTRLAQMDQGVQSLGVPIRGAGSPRGSALSGPSAPPAPKRVVEKYDVALSFAVEDRELPRGRRPGTQERGCKRLLRQVRDGWSVGQEPRGSPGGHLQESVALRGDVRVEALRGKALDHAPASARPRPGAGSEWSVQSSPLDSTTRRCQG